MLTLILDKQLSSGHKNDLKSLSHETLKEELSINRVTKIQSSKTDDKPQNVLQEAIKFKTEDKETNTNILLLVDRETNTDDYNLHIPEVHTNYPVNLSNLDATNKKDFKLNIPNTDSGLNYTYISLPQTHQKIPYYQPDVYRENSQSSLIKSSKKFDTYEQMQSDPQYLKQEVHNYGINSILDQRKTEPQLTVTEDGPFEVLLNKYNRFQCNKCWKDYMHKPGLVQHQKYECGKKPSFKCDFCNRLFYRNSSLKIHCNKLHAPLFNKDKVVIKFNDESESMQSTHLF